jgi:hypothetical protein
MQNPYDDVLLVKFVEMRSTAMLRSANRLRKTKSTPRVAVRPINKRPWSIWFFISSDTERSNFMTKREERSESIFGLHGE